MKHRYLFVIPAIAFSTGCANTNISKEVQATAGGVAIGAIAGAQVGGVRGAIIGGIIGGVIGNRIGAYMDEEDKKKLVMLESQSLLSGKETSFVTSKSKSKVTITPQETKVEVNPERAFNMPYDVVTQSLEVAAHDDVKAFVDTPVYRDVNEKAQPKQIIKAGENVHVAANVVNKDWGAVTNGNDVLGYVPLRYLNKDIQKQTKKTLARAGTTKPPKHVKAPELATVKADKYVTSSAIAPQAVASIAPSTVSVQATRVCKIVLIRLDPAEGSGPVTEERKHCKEPPKGWKTITADTQRRTNA